MLRTLYRLSANLFNARYRPHALIHPLLVVYHITNLCNLSCFYCEDFGVDKNPFYKPSELPTDQVKAILRMLRKKFDYIYITGGEPYVRQDLEELIDYMKEIGFRRISLNTKAVNLDRFPRVLEMIDDLVISLDSVDVDRIDEVIQCKKGTAQKIIDNIRWAAGLQKKHGFELSINCVVLPGSIEDARGVMRFAFQEGVKFSCIPQNVNYAIHPDFQDNREYQEFLESIIDLKKQTKLVSGTSYFFQNVLTISPFECYPNVVARVSAKGDLYWPCRPLNTFAGNLLQIGSYDETVKKGVQKYGILNACKKSCQMRCYIESSLLVKHPMTLLKEFFTGRGASSDDPFVSPVFQPRLPEAAPDPVSSLPPPMPFKMKANQ